VSQSGASLHEMIKKGRISVDGDSQLAGALRSR